MTLQVSLNHQTRYEYDRRVQMGPQVIRLRPAPHSRTPVPSYSLRIEPQGYFLNWQQDPHGNFMARVVFPEKVTHFFVEVDLIADMAVRNPFDFFLEPEAETYPFVYEAGLRKDLEPYLSTMPAPPLLKKWLRDLRGRQDVRTIDFLVELNSRLQSEIRYTIRLEPGVQSPEETLTLRSGSCRDTGWLLVQILRHLGIASRFVSGYLIQLVADVKALDGPSGATQDFTDLHAWCEAYLPGAGWVGLDPTSGLLAGEGHIPLACTPHPVSAAPITGAIEECETTFEHKMSVRRVVESPRVTKPYSDEQWRAIDEFGHRIERQLNTDDVRITIGGEPTFVASDDPDAPEWNTAAAGPTKRKFATELIQRLRSRYAPQGLLHYGQGKWYPGEQLPRWSFSLYWRRDGRPVWTDGTLIAKEDKDYGVTADTAREFLQGVANRLEVDRLAVTPAYEDPWHFISQERKLPENLDPATNRLDDPMARMRLARVFERGLGKPAGYVLPVQRWNAKAAGDPRRWVSEPWTTRSGRLFLLPGDSPLGFRLPLSVACLYSAARLSTHRAGGSVCSARRAAGPAPRTPTVPARRSFDVALASRAAIEPARRQPTRSDGHCRRTARWPPLRVPSARRGARGLHRPDRRRRRRERRARRAAAPRGLRAAERPAAQRAEGDAGSGRDRGEHPTREQLERDARDHGGTLRRRAPHSARNREVHARRPSHRHRRRQSRRARRGTPGGQPVPAPARPAAQPDHVLAASSGAVVSVLGDVHRPDESGAAYRRGSPRLALRARARVRASREVFAAARRGSWIGCSATC